MMNEDPTMYNDVSDLYGFSSCSLINGCSTTLVSVTKSNHGRQTLWITSFLYSQNTPRRQSLSI